jgi:hypothetical protein
MKLKKILLSTSMALTFFAGSSYATYPTFDSFNLAEAITSNVEQISARVERAFQEQVMRQLEKTLFLENANSESAKEMAKVKASNNMEKSKINHEIAQDLAPIDTCSTVADIDIAKAIGDTVNSVINSASGVEDDCIVPTADPDNKVSVVRKSATFTSPSLQEAAIKADAESRFAICQALLKDEFDDTYDGSNTSSNIASPSTMAERSWCNDPMLLVQQSISGYTADQYEAARQQVQIITEPVLRKRPLSSLESVSTAGKMSLLKEFRKDLLIGMAQRVLNDSVNMKKPIGFAANIENSDENSYFSELQRLEAFVAERQLSTDWYNRISNTDPRKFDEDGKQYSYNPEQVAREAAVIDGFLAHMAVLQYKSMLTQEALQAAILSVQVSKVD